MKKLQSLFLSLTVVCASLFIMGCDWGNDDETTTPPTFQGVWKAKEANESGPDPNVHPTYTYPAETVFPFRYSYDEYWKITENSIYQHRKLVTSSDADYAPGSVYQDTEYDMSYTATGNAITCEYTEFPSPPGPEASDFTYTINGNEMRLDFIGDEDWHYMIFEWSSESEIANSVNGLPY